MLDLVRGRMLWLRLRARLLRPERRGRLLPVSEASRSETDLLPPGGWEESRARLVSFVRGRLEDPDEAEDVVHEVFVRALERADTLTDDGRIEAWLYQITRNVLIDRHRSRTSAARALETFPGEAETRTLGGASRTDESEADGARAELAACLRPLVADLPEDYRLAVSMSELDGEKQREVAERLGLSVSGAKSRVQRGRRLLRERLLACCAVELDRTGVVIDWERRGERDSDSAAGCNGC